MSKVYIVDTIQAMEDLLNSLIADPRKPGEPPADFEDDDNGDDDEPDDNDDEDDDEEAA